MYRGNFEIEDRIVTREGLSQWSSLEITPDLIQRFQANRNPQDPRHFVSAKVYSEDFSAPLGDCLGAVLFSTRDRSIRVILGVFVQFNRLVIEFLPEDVNSRLNRFWFRFPARPDEKVYGGGEQFSHFNMRGRRFPLWTSEQGVGRNKKTPITFQADVQDRCGGDYWWTFFPQPTFVSSSRSYVHVDTPAYGAFDFRDPNFHELEFWLLPGRMYWFGGPSILETVQDLSGLLGRQAELPDWVHDGVTLGIQGGTEICDQKVRQAQAAGVPVNGIWAQDWEGIRMTSFGQRLMWNWQWDPKRYPKLPDSIKKWAAEGIRFMGYINPYVAVDTPLFNEAKSHGFLAKNEAGDDYLVDFGEFDAGIPDFTKPEAYQWYKSVIIREMLDLGLRGWMADFGEYLPQDTVVYDKTPGLLAHNPWPALWARINYEAVKEAGLSDEVVYFMRAGFTGSQKWCPMMWAGDQNVDWSEDDGLPSVIPAALSLAMSGHGLHHSDIGGYTTLYGMARTKELFLRWTEFAAFTPMMRTHEGNRPKDNWQFDSDPETLSGLGRMGQIFVALKEYRKAAVRENAQEGTPVMGPLFLHYEDDEAVWNLKDQYLLGRDLLCAPVIREGHTRRRVYLPRDRWVDLWTGQEVGVGELEVQAPMGYPPTFYRVESAWKKGFEDITTRFGRRETS